ncbi:histone-lysine N-methyltransferase SETMAR [Trichonephila clavipes]|nr:histone-lysine N-methyltransferase SETMAR [Trichonephila clavipes]
MASAILADPTRALQGTNRGSGPTMEESENVVGSLEQLLLYADEHYLAGKLPLGDHLERFYMGSKKIINVTPDLTPSDFHLFLHLKSFLAGKHFNNDKELKENVSNWLKTQAETFYEEGIEKLVPRYDTCLQNFGSYVER